MILKRIFSSFTVLLIAAGFVLAPIGQVTPAAQAHGYGNTVVYNLFATDAFVRLADGTTVYNYGFVGGRAGQAAQFQQSVGPGGDNFANTTLPDGFPTPKPGAIDPGSIEAQLAGNAQFPAPVIYAKVGDVVQINFKNLGTTNPDAPNDPHSIHLHGVDVNAANDGVPETSIGAIPANTDAPGAGNVIVYMFPAVNPGTYMYHCHQEADIHVNMGMYGALVIYNPTDAGAKGGPNAGGGNLYGFQYDKDYVLLMSEIDPAGHASEQTSGDYNWANYKPYYWFLNGLSFPQTIHAGFPEGYTWSDWIAAHPGYDPLIAGSPDRAPNHYWGTKGDKILIRMINMGFESQPMHMHGYHGKVLSSDQRAWGFANAPKMGYGRPTPFGQGMEKQTLLIGSGETYDWLIDMGQQALTSTYPDGSQTRYNDSGPQSNKDTGSAVIPFNGDPDAPGTYIGGPVVGPGSNDADSLVVKELLGTPIKGQLFPFHNHDDYKATNNGAYPGGMFTMIMTVPAR